MESRIQKKHKNSNFRNAMRRFMRNRTAVVATVILAIMILLAVFADVITQYGYEEMDTAAALQGPTLKHWFGTDNFGRDLFSRVLYGGRISLVVGFVSVGIGCLFGCCFGAIAGYRGGKVDMIIMRILDVFQAIPSLLMAISISAMLGTGIINCMLAVGITGIPKYARITRASVMSIKETEYIEAARAIGENDAAIILRHLIPNSLAPIIVQATLGLASGILSCASLSFIGLGVLPPTPEWGSILSAAKDYIYGSLHFIMFPGIAIVLAIVTMNLIGDGLRDALDPRLK
ncbi:MAG: ABC transporter permease [Lachnospiraceae bacterium]|nr:ABC transporter permease [Lachnospiraceae bacterium]